MYGTGATEHTLQAASSIPIPVVGPSGRLPGSVQKSNLRGTRGLHVRPRRGVTAIDPERNP
eukprot:6691474-Prymnesium_polylepis.1